ELEAGSLEVAGAAWAVGAAGATGAAGASTAGGATGAAAAGGVGGRGDVSTLTLTESLRSDDAFRNSRMLLPIDAPTSGSLPGPRISNAMTRMMMSSGAPMLGMSDLSVQGGRLGEHREPSSPVGGSSRNGLARIAIRMVSDRTGDT